MVDSTAAETEVLTAKLDAMEQDDPHRAGLQARLSAIQVYNGEKRLVPARLTVALDGQSVAVDSIASTNQKDLAKAKNYVLAALDAVEAGRNPDPAMTVPYGCAVKY
jgi:hypothetical protein